jgi:serine/threonine-protein phosphatase 5
VLRHCRAADNPYLFNGDFVDRGSWSVEVIVTLIAYMVLEPTSVNLNRGNHETLNMNRVYGFTGEVAAKFTGKTFPLFTELFCALPLGHCIGGKVLVVHGGLFSQDGVSPDASCPHGQRWQLGAKLLWCSRAGLVRARR